MYSIYWYKKQTKNLCTSESVCCLQHALIFEFFRHAGMRQMVTQYQEYYILSYTLTNWPSIAVIWINMHAWKITHDVHLFSLLAPQQVWLGNSKQVKIFKDLLSEIHLSISKLKNGFQNLFSEIAKPMHVYFLQCWMISLHLGI